jgi:hypothetical protein
MTDSAAGPAAAARLAAIALVLGAIAFVAVFLPDPGPTVRVAVLVVSGVASPLLTVVALLHLVATPLRIGRRYAASVVAATAVAFSSDLLFVLALRESVEASDAGLQPSAFGLLTAVFGLVSAVAFAALAALLLSALLRRDGGMRPFGAGVVSTLVATVISPFLTWSLAAPAVTVFPAVAVAAAALAALRRGRVITAARGESVALATRVRALGAGSLAYTAVVWVGAVATAVGATGTDAATVAYRVAFGAGQLAVVPLLVAGLLAAEHQHRAAQPDRRAAGAGAAAGAGDPAWHDPGVAVLRASTVVAVAVVGAGSVTLVRGLDDSALLVAVGVVSVAVALWTAAVAWVDAAGMPAASRLGLAAVVLLGGAIVYFIGVGMAAGITLALASGFLAFGGARPGRGTATSPATSRASV